MKGGFGFASLTVPGGITVAAAVAVNAFGDVRGLDGRIVAGCRTAPDSRELAEADRVLANLPPETPHPWEGNTTLAVVMTDAILSKATALKVCQMAFGGFYRTLVPALSMFDGDLIVTLSTGQKRAHVHQVGVLAERAVAEAILVAVREADGFGVLPGVRDLWLVPVYHARSLFGTFMKRRSDLWASLLPIVVAGLLLALAPRLPWLAPIGQPSPGLLLVLIAAGVAGASHRPLKGRVARARHDGAPLRPAAFGRGSGGRPRGFVLRAGRARSAAPAAPVGPEGDGEARAAPHPGKRGPRHSGDPRRGRGLGGGPLPLGLGGQLRLRGLLLSLHLDRAGDRRPQDPAAAAPPSAPRLRPGCRWAGCSAGSWPWPGRRRLGPGRRPARRPGPARPGGGPQRVSCWSGRATASTISSGWGGPATAWAEKEAELVQLVERIRDESAKVLPELVPLVPLRGARSRVGAAELVVGARGRAGGGGARSGQLCAGPPRLPPPRRVADRGAPAPRLRPDRGPGALLVRSPQAGPQGDRPAGPADPPGEPLGAALLRRHRRPRKTRSPARSCAAPWSRGSTRRTAGSSRTAAPCP